MPIPETTQELRDLIYREYLIAAKVPLSRNLVDADELAVRLRCIQGDCVHVSEFGGWAGSCKRYNITLCFQHSPASQKPRGFHSHPNAETRIITRVILIFRKYFPSG